MRSLNDGTLVFEEGLEVIKERECYENLEIKKIIFPDSLKRIETECFAGCHNIEELVFPSDLIEIGAGAFFENVNLKKVILNENIEIIGDGAFLSCVKLKNINFTNNLKEIKEMAFYACALEYVDLKENVIEVGNQAFWDNKDLKEVNILSPSCSLGLDIFGSCYNLKSGFIAKGYPNEMELFDELLYTILALTSFDKHNKDIQDIVVEFSKENIKILMEKILNTNNSKALNTLIKLNIINNDIESYLTKAFELKANELIPLLLQIQSSKEDLDL